MTARKREIAQPLWSTGSTKRAAATPPKHYSQPPRRPHVRRCFRYRVHQSATFTLRLRSVMS